MKRFLIVASILVTISLMPCPTQAGVISGSISGWAESSVQSWGDGSHDVIMVWSTAHDSGGDGWFCGMNCSEQNANLYIYRNFTDPLSISDASGFAYSTANVIANEGDTLFYRTLAGYYGAFIIDDIYPNPDYPTPGMSVPHTILDGRWYFQTDGTGNFDASPAPEPATMLLLGLGLLGLAGARRRMK